MNNISYRLKNVDGKIIFVCGSPYNLLIDVVLIMKDHIYDKSIIVIPTTSSKNIEYFAAISEKLKKLNIQLEIFRRRTWKNNIFYMALGLAGMQNGIVMRRVLKRINAVKGNYLLVNHMWDSQKVHYPAVVYFKYCKKAIFIEEGYMQYVTPRDPEWMLAIKKIYGTQTHFWDDSRLENIYVQNFVQYFDCKKIYPFSLRNIGLNKDEKEMIVSIFMSEADKQKLIDIGIDENRKGIIFTQPFSEDKYLTEREKIKAYADITKYYSKYGNILLKIHPRDTADYQIDGANILKGAYPSELFSILDISFDFAVGICTSAVETVDAKVRINLNENFLSDLQYKMIPLEIE